MQKRNWKEYNENLVRRALYLLGFHRELGRRVE
jgi:hypothetical protein